MFSFRILLHHSLVPVVSDLPTLSRLVLCWLVAVHPDKQEQRGPTLLLHSAWCRPTQRSDKESSSKGDLERRKDTGEDCGCGEGVQPGENPTSTSEHPYFDNSH